MDSTGAEWMLTQAARCFSRREREISRASGREGQVTRTRRNWVGMVSRRYCSGFGEGRKFNAETLRAQRRRGRGGRRLVSLDRKSPPFAECGWGTCDLSRGCPFDLTRRSWL